MQFASSLGTTLPELEEMERQIWATLIKAACGVGYDGDIPVLQSLGKTLAKAGKVRNLLEGGLQ
jgi:hypothetical protein